MSNRVRKADGSPGSLSKDAWECMASQRDAVASALLWLVCRSYDVLLDNPVDETPPETYCLEKLVAIRKSQEVVDASTEWLSEPTAEQRELRCLLHTMLRWAVQEQEQAKAFLRMAAQQRVGRPRKQPTYDELLDRLRPAPPAKLGRPPLVSLSDAELIAKIQSGMGGGRTQRASLRALAEELLKSSGQHTAGNRVTRMVSNLEKRLAPSSRARLRKSRL